MTCENQYKPSGVHAKTVGTLDADDAKDIVECFNEARTDNHPAISLLVNHRLCEMCKGYNREENCKEYRGWHRGAKSPLCVHQICAS